MRHIVSKIGSLVASMLVVGLTGCSSDNSAELSTTADVATTVDTSTTTSRIAPGPNRSACERERMYTAIVPRTLDELIRRTEAIVVGTVGEQRVTKFNEKPPEPHRPLPPPTTWISPDGVNKVLPPENYGERGELPATIFDLGTDSEVTIERVLAGSVGSTESFTLRNLGDGHLVCDPADPIAEPGQRYVFFLGRAGWEPSQPPGGVWYASGNSTGRYRLDADDRLRAERSRNEIRIAGLDGITLTELEALLP